MRIEIIGKPVLRLAQQRRWLLASPYDMHEAVLATVDTARCKAIDADPWVHFAWFGTCSVDGPAQTVFGVVRAVGDGQAWIGRPDVARRDGEGARDVAQDRRFPYRRIVRW